MLSRHKQQTRGLNQMLERAVPFYFLNHFRLVRLGVRAQYFKRDSAVSNRFRKEGLDPNSFLCVVLTKVTVVTKTSSLSLKPLWKYPNLLASAFFKVSWDHRLILRVLGSAWLLKKPIDMIGNHVIIGQNAEFARTWACALTCWISAFKCKIITTWAVGRPVPYMLL